MQPLAGMHCFHTLDARLPPSRVRHSAPVGTVADQVRAPHMLVADSPELLGWLNAKLKATVYPALSAQFHLDDM